MNSNDQPEPNEILGCVNCHKRTTRTEAESRNIKTGFCGYCGYGLEPIDAHPQPVVGDDELKKQLFNIVWDWFKENRFYSNWRTLDQLAEWTAKDFHLVTPENSFGSLAMEVSLLVNILLKARVQAHTDAAVREAEKRAEVRWKREHDYWKTTTENLLKRDQLATDPKMVIELPGNRYTASQVRHALNRVLSSKTGPDIIKEVLEDLGEELNRLTKGGN